MANKIIDKAVIRLKNKYELDNVSDKDGLMSELKVKLIMDKTTFYNHFRAIISEDNDMEVMISKVKSLYKYIYAIDELEMDIKKFNQLLTMEA